MLVGMATVHEPHQRRRVGEVTWHSAIGVGIGDDDTIEAVAEAEHDGELAARAWVERTLPAAQFPDWVTRRPHGAAGAFLFGQIERGYYTVDQGDQRLVWEPDPDAPSWDADLVGDVVSWRAR